MDILVLQERVKTTLMLGEGHFREFKSALMGPPSSKSPRPWRDIAKDVAETLTAFANADGGTLLVGIEDDGSVSGVETHSETNIAEIKKAPVTRIHQDTPLSSVDIHQISIGDHSVLYFSVQKSIKYVHLTSDGRCLQRRDLESVPVPPEIIQFERQEQFSRDYDRHFTDGASAADLNLEQVRVVAEQISRGMTAEKALQFLGLAEYGSNGLRLRNAALLLFAKKPERWHPRLQVRLMKVNGTALGVGEQYNVIDDQIIQGNIITLIENGWESIRPHLVQTRLTTTAQFQSTVMYPELACREALVNAIAHRDYADQGRGIEIYVYPDRLEVKNPGELLTTMTVDNLVQLQGAHQSRNALIARVLREVGYMRELGEGVRRMFELMKQNELMAPEFHSGAGAFSVELKHAAIYSQQEKIWLDQFASLELDREQKAVIVLGRTGELIAHQYIVERLGIVDTEHYRKIVASLQGLGILKTEVSKTRATALAHRARIPVREIPRFRVVPPSEGGMRRKSVLLDKVEHQDVAVEKRLDSASGRFSTRIHAIKNDEFTQDINRLCILNLPNDISEDDLRNYFQAFGEVTYVNIPHKARKGIGYAFIEYSQNEIAASLLSNPPQALLMGRVPVVQRAKPRISTGYGRNAR